MDFKFPILIQKAYEDTEDKEFHITGYISTSALDLQNDVIAPEALDLKLEDFATQTLLYNHNQDRPIGALKKLKKTKKGLWIDAIIDRSATIIETGINVVDAIKQKILNKFSFKAKVVEAVDKFLSRYDRVVNYVTRILPVEASLVCVPANPEAEGLGWYEKSLSEFPRAIGWYLTKALEENGGRKMPDEILESVGFPEIDNEEFFKGLGDVVEGSFLTADEICKSFEEFLKERKLTESDKQDLIDKSWEEFCESKQLPKPYPKYPVPAGRYPEPKTGQYPYPGPTVSKQAIKEIFFLLDKLTKGPNEKITNIAKQIKAMLSRAVEYPTPATAYPKPYPYPKPAGKKEGEKVEEKIEKLFGELGIDEKGQEDLKKQFPKEEDLLKHLEEKATAKKLEDEKNEKEKNEKGIEKKLSDLIDEKFKTITEKIEKGEVVRKGLDINESKTTLEKALEGKSEQEKLNILLSLERKG